VVAAALYLFMPVGWYDSALWGQVDAIGALLMLAAVLALGDGWTEPAMVLATLGVLVKPQDAICFVVVLPLLVRRHLLRIGSGPMPQLGRHTAALDARLGGRLTDQGPLRLGTSILLGAVVGVVLLLPFDLGVRGPASLADLPVIGQVAGLIGLFGADTGQFSVLTANAFNGWALVGSSPLTSIASGGGSWTSDSLVVVAGLTAVEVGAILLAMVGLLVATGLLVRDDRRTPMLGFALMAFAFYALPTRVHERYLFPFFPAAALLAAPYLVGALAYFGAALLNAVNLHAVLGSGNSFGGFGGAGNAGGRQPGSGVGPGGAGLGPGGLPGPGLGHGGGVGAGSGLSWPKLPFSDIATSQPVIACVAVGQTLVLVALVGMWLVVAFGPLLRSAGSRASEANAP
jgi:hypothetical protein